MNFEELESAITDACRPLITKFWTAKSADSTVGFSGTGRVAKYESEALARQLGRWAARLVAKRSGGDSPGGPASDGIELALDPRYSQAVESKEQKVLINIEFLKCPDGVEWLVDFLQHADLASNSLELIRDAAAAAISKSIAAGPPADTAMRIAQACRDEEGWSFGQRQAFEKIIEFMVLPSGEEWDAALQAVSGLTVRDFGLNVEFLKRLKHVGALIEAQYALNSPNGSPVKSMSVSPAERAICQYDIRPERGKPYRGTALPPIRVRPPK